MKRLTLIGITLTLLLSLALLQQQHISVANAAPMALPPIVIDDFNTGLFSISHSLTINDLPASGAIGGSRDANVHDTQGSPLYGYMNLEAGTNYLEVQNGGYPGDYNVAWGNNSLFGGSDLNLNASGYDRLVVNLLSAPNPSGTITVRFNNSGSPSATLPLNGPGDYTFLFSSPGLMSLNTADIDGITISFTRSARVESVIITAPTCIDQVVTTNADSGAGSLRQAIIDACPGSTITFDTAGVFATPQIITLTTGELVVDKSLTIDGPGASQVTVSGNNASRVFYMSPNTMVTLDGLTITGGNGIGAGGNNSESGAGGGIFSDKNTLTGGEGTLTLTNCTVSGNSATHGGGIYSNGSTLTILTITNSTVSGNSAADDGLGGGIENNGTLVLINSTVSGNSGGGGGGIGTGPGGTMTLINSTVSGNSGGKGGGIMSLGRAKLINSTITGNSASNSGGGFFDLGLGGGTTANNTIIAGNYRSDGTTPDDILGAITSSSNPANNNLIGDAATSGSGLTDGTNGNIVGIGGAGTIDINTVLDTTLAHNGGPTRTHRLKPNSPAIDAGSNALALDAANQPLTTDQRGSGFARSLDGNGDSTEVVDIGAFEALLVSIGFTTSPAGLSITVDGTSYTSPQTFSWVPGSSHTIATTSPQNPVAGTQYVFQNWSDSGALSHSVTVPASPTTYTANFKTQYQLTTSAGTGGTISPASGFYDQGVVVITSSANPGYTFAGFGGALTGTTNPQNLSLTSPRSVTATFTAPTGFNFTGFFQPVDNAPTVNTAAAGSSIPLKFSLGGNQGLFIFEAGYPRSQVIVCSSGNPTDVIEETATAGSSSLSYDATTNQYKYTWKTEKAWKGTCRKLVVKFSEGTTREALFQFR